MTLLALVVAVTAGAQIIDTTTTGNAMHMNLNLGKLDSTIRSLQEIVEAQQATIESLQAGSSFDGDYNSLSNLPNLFDGDYNSLSNQPTIPSNVSDLTNDAGFTTFDGDYNSLSNQLTQKHIVQWAHHLSSADLSGANLSNANFSGVSLAFANLIDADLTNANLTNAELSGANLTGATLQNTIWTGAHILGCTGCTCLDADFDNYCD